MAAWFLTVVDAPGGSVPVRRVPDPLICLFPSAGMYPYYDVSVTFIRAGRFHGLALGMRL